MKNQPYSFKKSSDHYSCKDVRQGDSENLVMKSCECTLIGYVNPLHKYPSILVPIIQFNITNEFFSVFITKSKVNTYNFNSTELDKVSRLRSNPSIHINYFKFEEDSSNENSDTLTSSDFDLSDFRYGEHRLLAESPTSIWIYHIQDEKEFLSHYLFCVVNSWAYESDSRTLLFDSCSALSLARISGNDYLISLLTDDVQRELYEISQTFVNSNQSSTVTIVEKIECAISNFIKKYIPRILIAIQPVESSINTPLNVKKNLIMGVLSFRLLQILDYFYRDKEIRYPNEKLSWISLIFPITNRRAAVGTQQEIRLSRKKISIRYHLLHHNNPARAHHKIKKILRKIYSSILVFTGSLAVVFLAALFLPPSFLPFQASREGSQIVTQGGVGNGEFNKATGVDNVMNSSPTMQMESKPSSPITNFLDNYTILYSDSQEFSATIIAKPGVNLRNSPIIEDYSEFYVDRGQSIEVVYWVAIQERNKDKYTQWFRVSWQGSQYWLRSDWITSTSEDYKIAKKLYESKLRSAYSR